VGSRLDERRLTQCDVGCARCHSDMILSQEAEMARAGNTMRTFERKRQKSNIIRGGDGIE